MSVLDEIVAGALADLDVRQAQRPLGEIERLAADQPPARPVLDRFAAPGLAVIAEVKRRSPSKGDLAAIPDPAALATAYTAGGAAAISVLTEERRFSGSLADLAAVRAAVETPLLRKDFLVTEYQIIEARATGADLVLLIVAALDDATLARLHQLAVDLGMAVLVEVHDTDEAKRAAAIGAPLIGVNTRNLKTLAVDPDTFARVMPALPDTAIKVAESGITGPDDAARYAAEGADVVLVGEALVKDGNPQAAVAAMRAAGGAQ